MFQVAEGKLPADYQVYYLPFSLMKVVKKIYSIDRFGLTFLPKPKIAPHLSRSWRIVLHHLHRFLFEATNLFPIVFRVAI